MVQIYRVLDIDENIEILQKISNKISRTIGAWYIE